MDVCINAMKICRHKNQHENRTCKQALEIGYFFSGNMENMFAFSGNFPEIMENIYFVSFASNNYWSAFQNCLEINKKILFIWFFYTIWITFLLHPKYLLNLSKKPQNMHVFKLIFFSIFHANFFRKMENIFSLEFRKIFPEIQSLLGSR